MRSISIAILSALLCVACLKKSKEQESKPIEEPVVVEQVDSVIGKLDTMSEVQLGMRYVLPFYTEEQINSFHDSTFVVLKKIDTTFLYDMKYASTDNFLNEKVYDCDDCLLRYKTVKLLRKAHEEFKTHGYRIQFFDCYRPLDVQRKMWKLVSDERYVANPEKGSNHNRGTAVDITLVDSLGNKLAMGTGFDHFGREAHHAYTKLPDSVLRNRKLLKTIMEKHGFWSITSEWWHYNLNKSYKYKVSNFTTECETNSL